MLNQRMMIASARVVFPEMVTFVQEMISIDAMAVHAILVRSQMGSERIGIIRTQNDTKTNSQFAICLTDK